MRIPATIQAALVIVLLSLSAPSGAQAQGTSPGRTADFTKEGELIVRAPSGAVKARIAVEIAESPQERSTGLMFRERLGEGEGMLFLFPEERPLSFWMKNTPLPLDIIFVSAKGEIVSIHENTVPFSEGSVASGRPAQYVLEVNAGIASARKFKVGDRVYWQKL